MFPPEGPGVYVLHLKNGCIYVGQSQHVAKRVESHKNGKDAAAFVLACGGVQRYEAPKTPRLDELTLWEQNEFLVQVIIHGAENVRGADITQTTPWTLDDYQFVIRLIIQLGNLCRLCGYDGHFYTKCTRPANLAPWLAKMRKAIEKITARESLENIIRKNLNQVTNSTERVRMCERCFRSSHTTANCTAKCTVTGEIIPINTFTWV